ncbi:MAG: TonB-dependent receptor plug domain-containing protein [Syntrophobacteraceae bacterium]
MSENRCTSFWHYQGSLYAKWLITVLAISLFLFLVLEGGTATAAGPPEEDLTALSIEDLMGISITSAAKRPQRLSEAAAAVFVIHREDIRRSGATSIPELLRMVPGIEVARIDANKWAVSSRGFNGRFANKLLVLFDGRTVYSPLFSGVFWDQQNYMMEDIERIEVIRGPGASLWGANAVNGVINIITKKAKDTQGGLASGAGGSRESFGGVRYGGKYDDSTYYRAYSKYYNHAGFSAARGLRRDDSWNYSISGFRIDRELSSRDSLTVQGDFQNNSINETYLVPTFAGLFPVDTVTAARAGNFITRWNRTLSPTSNIQVQAYYDGIDFSDVAFGEKRHTVDFELQHQFSAGSRHSVVWGLGFRSNQDTTEGSPGFSLAQEHHHSLFSAFLQDEIKLIEDRLTLVLGSRLEHHDSVGFEVQPNVRLLWTPHKKHTFWAAVSRAVRTPSWAEEDLQLDFQFQPPNTIFRLVGNPDYESEELKALELGYRFVPSEGLSFDITGFYNIYNNLRSLETGNPIISPPVVIIPLISDNKLDGDAYGFELSADYQVRKWWRLQAAYSFLQMDLSPQRDSTDLITGSTVMGSNPHNQFSLRSWIDLPYKMEFDLWLKYVGDLPSINVESYTILDARLAWRPRKNLEISIVGQNLLDRRHVEAISDFVPTIESQIERSVYGKIVWRF